MNKPRNRTSYLIVVMLVIIIGLPTRLIPQYMPDVYGHIRR